MFVNFLGNIRWERDKGDEVVVLDEWIRFYCDRKTASLLFDIRRQLDALLDNRIINPTPVNFADAKNPEIRFLNLVANLLEEEQLRLKLRPKKRR